MPLARPVPQASLHVRPAALERLRAERARSPCRQHQPYLAFGRLARGVAPGDGNAERVRSGIGQAQPTASRAIAPGVEEERAVATLPIGVHHPVHLRNHPARVAHIRPRLHVEVAAKTHPPVPLPLAPGPRQPLRGVPHLEVPRAQRHARPRREVERHRPVLPPLIVRGPKVHHSRLVGVIDHQQHPLAYPLARGDQQRQGVLVLHGIVGAAAAHRGSREVAQVPHRIRHQVHHLEGAVGRDRQAPLAHPVPEAPLEVRTALLERLRAERARSPCRQHQPYLAFGRLARGVAPGDGNAERVRSGIGQAQPTASRAIAPGVEEERAVATLPIGVHHPVHLRNHPARVAHIRPRLHVEVAAKTHPPVPLPLAPGPRQPLRGVPHLEVPRAQRHARPRREVERHRPVLPPLIVRGPKVHHSRLVGVIDHPQHPLAYPLYLRQQQRQGPGPLGLARPRRRHADAGKEGAGNDSTQKSNRKRGAPHRLVTRIGGIHLRDSCPPPTGGGRGPSSLAKRRRVHDEEEP